jgi:TP901 family phage tail tape measure protein
MVTTVAQMQGILTLDDKQFKSSMTAAQKGMRNFGSNIRSAGIQMTKFGAGMSLALAPVTLFLKNSISAFQDFDVAMTNAQAILSATNEEMEILNAQVLEIGKASRAGPQAAAEAYFTIVSGVQDATTHMDILTSSINLSEAGLADLAVTTDGMVAVMNAYRFEAEQAAFVSDTMTRTVQMGVGTMDQFVAALKPVAGMASTIGIDFEELAATTAFLTSKGASASEATTQLSAVMTAFLKPNTDMQKALEAMGVTSGKTFLETHGLVGAMNLLSDSLGGSEDALVQVLGRQEAIRGGFQLTSQGVEEFVNTFESGIDGATEKAQEFQNATDAAKIDLFKSRLDALSITLGESLSNALGEVATALTPVIDDILIWIDENPELTQSILIMSAALVLFAGGLLVAGGLVTALGGALSALFTPITLSIIAVGGLVFAVGEIFDFDWPSLKTLATNAFERMQHWAGVAEEAIAGVLRGLGDVKDAAEDVADFFSIGGSQAVGQLAAQVRAQPGFSQRPITIPSFQGGTQSSNALLAAFSSQLSNSQGRISRADGGQFGAFQPMTVGERGPEKITFPVPGNVESSESMRKPLIGTVVIHANSEEEGRAAGRGFKAELGEILIRDGN